MIRELLSRLDSPFTGEVLFDHLNDIVFFIKNTKGQYLVVNNTLVERCGLPDKEHLIGRTTRDVLQAPLGERFAEQDEAVISTGVPLLSQLELHVHASKRVGWCLTTKLPLRDRQGCVIGLVGISQDLRLPDVETEEYQNVATALDFARNRLTVPPSVEELASVAGMTRYQLDRRMQHVFGITTGQWLLQLRIDKAQQKLVETEDSIASIAIEVGYSCQSAFTRQFRRTTGMSPREYRMARSR